MFRFKMDRWGWDSDLIPVLHFGYFPHKINEEINNITEEFLNMVCGESNYSHLIVYSEDLKMIESNISNNIRSQLKVRSIFHSINILTNKQYINIDEDSVYCIVPDIMLR